MFKPMFVPPRQNPLLCRFTNAVLPAMANFLARIKDVRMPAEDLDRLRSLEAHPAILAPNHPTGMDPVVMLWVSRTLGQPFQYLAAREVLVGFKGWYLNQLGAYSVIRGTADRESMRATRRLLAEGRRKVVIFPEGEIYEHNDHLLAFEPGVAQLGFWSLEDMRKAQREPALPLVPVAVRYRCCEAARPAIENSLRSLEGALGLSAPGSLTAYERLRRIGSVMMATVERELGIQPDPARPLTERIAEFRATYLARVAQAMGSELDPDITPADQLHRLFNDLREWVGDLPDGHNDYELRRYRHRLMAAAPLFQDLERFQNFIVVSGDYVAQNPTAERFLEVLGRLEKEVFGEVRNCVSREALVRIGQPIRLEERYDAYRQGKREQVQGITREMEASIRGMLQDMASEGTPISLDF
jgi:hypothetical protein